DHERALLARKGATGAIRERLSSGGEVMPVFVPQLQVVVDDARVVRCQRGHAAAEADEEAGVFTVPLGPCRDVLLRAQCVFGCRGCAIPLDGPRASTRDGHTALLAVIGFEAV